MHIGYFLEEASPVCHFRALRLPSLALLSVAQGATEKELSLAAPPFVCVSLAAPPFPGGPLAPRFRVPALRVRRQVGDRVGLLVDRGLLWVFHNGEQVLSAGAG